MKIVFLSAALLIFVARHYGRCETIDEILEAALNSPDIDEAGAGTMDHPDADDTVVIELDMKFTKKDWEDFQRENRGYQGSRRRRKRKARSSKRWPDNTIPYRIASGFSNKDREQISQAIREWTDATCLNFRLKEPNDVNYVEFVVGTGCNSYVGMKGGRQNIILGPDKCRKRKVISHEIGHAIGFVHEQTRLDRDQYVTINWTNIKTGKGHNFNNSIYRVNNYNVAYDYLSLMHYGQYALSKNKTTGLRTIITKDPYYQDKIGNATTLSSRDIQLANTMYGCYDNGQQNDDAPACINESTTKLCPLLKGFCADVKVVQRICKETCANEN